MFAACLLASIHIVSKPFDVSHPLSLSNKAVLTPISQFVFLCIIISTWRFNFGSFGFCGFFLVGLSVQEQDH